MDQKPGQWIGFSNPIQRTKSKNPPGRVQIQIKNLWICWFVKSSNPILPTSALIKAITLRYLAHYNKRRWSEKHCSRITIASISLIFLNEIYNLVSPKCYNSGYQEQTLIATHIRSSISECKRHGTQDEAAGRHLRRNVGVSKCWAPIGIYVRLEGCVTLWNWSLR